MVSQAYHRFTQFMGSQECHRFTQVCHTLTQACHGQNQVMSMLYAHCSSITQDRNCPHEALFDLMQMLGQHS